MPELRRDPVSSRWVIIATERSKRPSDFKHPVPLRTPDICPFCPGNEALTPPEVAALRAPGSQPDTPGWTVRVVTNKYPALDSAGELLPENSGFYEKLSGVGSHEVVIESPNHEKSLADLTVAEISDVLTVCRTRIAALMTDSRYRYVTLFKNEGEAAGASLAHAHFQLIATPVVPQRVREEVDHARKYFHDKKRCIFCEIIKQELSDRTRIVGETNTHVALAPFAARVPFETWILPKSHQPDFHTITEAESLASARIIKDTLCRLRTALNNPAYNLFFHVAPSGAGIEYHWHIEIIPRLTRMAGFEWATGFYINPTSPEEAAEILRGAAGPGT